MAARKPRRPLPEGQTFFTPNATGLRRQIERRSAAPLVFLHQMPGWVVPIALVAVLIAGFAVKGWIGAAALLAIAVFLSWFSYLSWPSLELPGRLMRGAVIAVVIALAVAKGLR